MATSTITSGLNVTHDKFDYVIADVKHDAISPQQLI